MTLPTWIASGTIAATATNNTAITPAPPNGAIGDLLIMVLERQDGTAAPTITGWTNIPTATAVSGILHSVATYWKIATSATGTTDQTAVTFGSSTVLRSGRVFRFRNTSLITPIHLASINMVLTANAATVNATNITSTRADTTGVFIAAMIGQRSTTNTTTNWPATTGVTAFASANNTTGNDSTFGIGVKQFAVAGSYLTPGIVWTTNTTTGPGAGILLALNEEFGPNAPTSSVATSIAGTGFTANWSAPGTDSTHDSADGYVLEISTASNFSTHTVTGYTTTYAGYGGVIGLDVGNVLSAAVTGLTPGVTYYYRVTAYNTYGGSAASGSQSPTTLLFAPNTPGLSGTPAGAPVVGTPTLVNLNSGSLTTTVTSVVVAAGVTGLYVRVGTGGGAAPITGIVWGTDALSVPTGDDNILIWRLLNPTPGTHDIVVTLSSTGYSGVIAVSTVTLQGSPAEGTVKATNGVGTTAPSVGGLSGTSNDLILEVTSRSSNTSDTVTGTGQVQDFQQTSIVVVQGSKAPGTTATLGWTNASFNGWIETAIPLLGSVTGVTTSITGTGFTANWTAPGTDGTHDAATGYYLEVATDAAFTSHVNTNHDYSTAHGSAAGYDAGNVLTLGVTGLASATTYYWRVWAYNAAGPSAAASSSQNPTTTGSGAVTRSLTGSEPYATGAISYFKSTARTLTGSEPYPTGVLSRLWHANRSALAGSEPYPTGALTKFKTNLRSLTGSEPYSTAAHSRIWHAFRSALTGSEPYPTGSATRLWNTTRPLTGSEPGAGGVVSRIWHATRSALSGSEPYPTGTVLHAWNTVRSGLAGSEPYPTGVLASVKVVARTHTGSEPYATGVLSRTWHANAAALTGAQPYPTGTILRSWRTTKTLIGSEPYPTGAVTRLWHTAKSLTGSVPAESGTITRAWGTFKTLAGSQPYPTGTLTGVKIATRSLTGSEPYATGAITRTLQRVRSVTGSEPYATGTITRIAHHFAGLTGSEPNPTGAVSRIWASRKSLTGSEPAASASLLHGISTTRTLTGSEPAPTGIIARGLLTAYRVVTGSEPYARGIEHATKTMLGSEPYPTGTVSRIWHTSRAVTGSQPAASGIVGRAWGTFKSLAGNQPGASGILGRVKRWLRTALGSEPGASGSVDVLTGLHHFFGDQPAPTGRLTVVHMQRRVLAGSEPFSTGRAVRVWQITGVQPAATGSLVAHHVGPLLYSGRYVRTWEGRTLERAWQEGHSLRAWGSSTFQRTWAGRHFRSWAAKISKE